MNLRNKPEEKKFNNKVVDLMNSYEDDDDSIEIEIVETTKKTDKSSAKILSNGRELSSNKLTEIGDFLKKVDQRTKTKEPIDVDFSLAPSLHTRSKVGVINLNQFVTKNSDREQKELNFKRYEPARTFNHRLSQESRMLPPMKQLKLDGPRIDDMKKYGFDTLVKPKPGESIYPQKKKPEPEKPLFQGIEYRLINSNKYIMTEKERELKRKEKEEKLRKEKEKEEQIKEERKKRYESLFFGDFETSEHKKETEQKEESQSEDEELKNLDMLEQIENDQREYEGTFFETDEERLAMQRRGRFGLNEVIRPYDSSHAFPFVKAILGYNFGQENETSNARRIPNIFTDEEVYKKTFHYLVINESIADIQQRIKKLEKDTAEKLEIEIISISQNSNGLSELKIKETDHNPECIEQETEEEKEKKEKFLLKNYSMSKNRIGVITSQESFRISKFGIHSFGKEKNELSFTFLCLLKTPESKQELKDDVRVEAFVSESELEFILKMKKNRKAYFYDIEKLSTNIREYMSISNIEYSFLAPHIYNPNFIETEKRNLVHADTRDSINDVLSVLEKSFNKTQFESIREMALRESGIVLLQGPPGTGKTSTLLGLLSAQYAYLKKIGDSRKIMICAPSNAAIDHIAKRIRTEGLINGEGNKIHPNVLRLGIVETEDPDITSCALDHICESKIVAEKDKSLRESNMTTIQIREKLMLLQKQIRNLNQQMNKANREKNFSSVEKLEEEIKESNREYIRLEGLQYSFRREKIVSKKLYQEMEKELIKQAEILIVTLSSSGGEKIEQVRNDIACLIVDEAAQATEPSLLIAFQTGVDKVMLIGDPYQLPATTISPDSNKTLFNRSLFERFIDAGIEPYFLNVQYRMSPMIREFPSDKFYQQRLVDGETIFKREVPSLLKPFSFERSVIFIDLKYGQERVQESSFCNQREANLITKILKKYKLLDSDISVGIITPYQAQRKLLAKEIDFLENQLQNKKSNNSSEKENEKEEKVICKKNSIMINTIDSFQGQEKDLIFISTVRANDRKQIGFLMDERRINVSISRAKHAMIIIGNGDTLGSNEIWDGYLKFIEGNKLYFEINTIEDEEKIVESLNKRDFFNSRSIRRRYYEPEELTFDPRKIKMKEMNSEVFKKKGKNKQQEYKEEFNGASKITDQNTINLDSQIFTNYQLTTYNPQESKRQKTSETIQNFNEIGKEYQSYSFDTDNPMKKSHIPYNEDLEYQAEELIKKKRKQEEETKEFEKYCQRLKEVEKEKANDDYYKFLFQ